jgi:hypothetical protein
MENGLSSNALIMKLGDQAHQLWYKLSHLRFHISPSLYLSSFTPYYPIKRKMQEHIVNIMRNSKSSYHIVRAKGQSDCDT